MKRRTNQEARKDSQRFAAVLLLTTIAALLLMFPIEQRAGARQPVRGKHAMVASASEIASAVGVDVLKRGGNAADAAVAVGLALAVVYPIAGNIGGGGFMVVRTADGKSIVIDYRETAPARASRNMYLDKDGNLIPKASTVGYLAAGTPGTVAGLALAHERYGKLKWEDLVEPARRLAAEGFTVSYNLAKQFRNDSELLGGFSDSRRIFLRDGNYYQEGESIKQPELAETLRRIKERGPREFYEGRTAELIAEDMKANGGIMTLEDLKNYKPAVRETLKGTYRGYEIVTMPPPSSGGVALLEMLNILEHYDLASMGHNSSGKYHVMIEAMRRAFADRAEFLGDPDFVKVPTAGLTSKKYADNLFKSIEEKASSSSQIGAGRPAAYESTETTHFTIVDEAGNAVSNTYTLNGAFGSGATARGTGILLNNEMDDFAAKPGVPNDYDLIQGEANAVAPFKRPLSSMTPTMVLKDGKLYFVIGSPGGPTIINTVLQTIVNVIDHGMNIQQAIDEPRIHHQWLPDKVKYEPYGLSKDVMDALSARGHKFSDKPANMGDAEGVMIEAETGFRLGASDPRNGDARAVGY